MRYLLFVSILIVALTGCVQVRPGKITKEDTPVLPDSVTKSWFSGNFEKALFRGSFDIRKHHLSGLYLVKKMETGGYRVVFTNQVGITFFDLGLRNDSLEVIYCFESLNRKALLNIIRTDLILLLTDPARFETVSTGRQASAGSTVTEGKLNKIHAWHTWDPGYQLTGINGKSGPADKAKIRFKEVRDGFPGSIVIENPVVGMKMEMHLLSH